MYIYVTEYHTFVYSGTIIIFNKRASLACAAAACGHYVSAESPCGRLELLNLTYFWIFLLYINIVNKG